MREISHGYRLRARVQTRSVIITFVVETIASRARAMLSACKWRY